ncbi:MAG TPA: type II 3-dehydroquinate dehydratase [Candidatus Anaerotignum merdipullorum]|nr:type II 3-dehydroquinate dehydratase [Candidatus Anaerotignum merdipullorum]
MKVLVLNGPNLNMLGIREKQIYGTQTYEDLKEMIDTYCQREQIEVEIFQSNHEGALVDRIQQTYFDGTHAIVINPAAYTHTSVAILDALKAVQLPAVEVHLSDVSSREAFRQISYAGMACEKTIMGKGFAGYLEALKYLKEAHDK